jgi:UDP-galactose transporter B1
MPNAHHMHAAIYSTNQAKVTMVTTRRTNYDAIVEEKKDDDDLIARDASTGQFVTKQDENSSRHPYQSNIRVEIQQTEPTQKKSPLMLLLCASGITSCYLWYGTVQETLNSNREKESITLFLLATGTFSSFLLAWIWTNVGQKILTTFHQDDKAEGKLNHVLLVLTSTTYLSAMAASNESLHYVSYPTCVLAKSSKLIPTMVVGWLIDKFRGQSHGSNKSHSVMEWVGAALITMGILSFQYTQLKKQHSNNGGNEQGDSPYGLFLLGLSLFMDGLLGACQSALKRKGNYSSAALQTAYRPPTAMETMLYINLYATMILLPASYYAGQFQNGMQMFLDADGDMAMLLLQLNLSASLGQVFIFLTIHHFSSLICTTITTTRKFFTILLSVYKFGHVLDVWQWGSVGLVFGGLYLEIAAKMFGQRVEKNKAE